ncbi:MAG: BatD family protein [Saprospiraceae bacterium]|nr:BatD family protein [Saprospiraceae bacterium]
MKHLIVLALLISCSQLALTQEMQFFVQASRDTILEGHLVQLTYHVENAEVENFESPTFEGFSLVAGPQQSSSMHILNGKVSRQASITYILASESTGVFTLEPARITLGDKILECLRKTIVVLPNPGEKPDPQFPGYRPRAKPEKPSGDPRQNLLSQGRRVYKM